MPALGTVGLRDARVGDGADSDSSSDEFGPCMPRFSAAAVPGVGESPFVACHLFRTSLSLLSSCFFLPPGMLFISHNRCFRLFSCATADTEKTTELMSSQLELLRMETHSESRVVTGTSWLFGRRRLLLVPTRVVGTVPLRRSAESRTHSFALVVSVPDCDFDPRSDDKAQTHAAPLSGLRFGRKYHLNGPIAQKPIGW